MSRFRHLCSAGFPACHRAWLVAGYRRLLPWLLGALCLPAAAWAQVVNGDFSAGLTGWTVSVHGAGSPSGAVVADGGAARMTEGASFLVLLEQEVTVPPGAAALLVDVTPDPAFDTSAGGYPDAVEVHLLGANGAPLVAPWRVGASAAFALHEDGTAQVGAQTTWNPPQVRIDLAGVPPGTAARVVVALLGGDDDTASGVRIDNVGFELAPNDPPVAVAGADRTFPCGLSQPVVLDGSASYDPDGGALTYEWTAPDGGTVGTTATVEVSPPAGTHVYTLTVTDALGAQSSDTLTVTVGTPTPGCGCSMLSGDVDASGAVNIVDVQCIILTVLWYSQGGAGSAPGCLAGPPVIADLDCVTPVDVVDVLVDIYLALGASLPVDIDADQDGCVDTCQATP